MSPARTLALLLVWLALSVGASTARAQDALGRGADFSDDWDAFLKLVPPSSATAGTRVSAVEAGKRERSGRSGERDAKAEKRGRAVDETGASVSTRGEREPSEADASRRQRREEREAEAALSRREQSAPRGASLVGDTRDTRDTRAKRAKPELMDVPGYAPGGYEGLAASWHASWPDTDAQKLAAAARSAPALSLHPVGKLQTPYVLIPQGADGGFDEGQIEVASKAFGSWQGGPRVSARLLDLIYHAAKHFDVYHVHLVSGVRHDRSGSRHSHGLAADIVFPGVEDDELAAYFRPQGFCGVGIYTRAGFVHIDVRERSYFWLDKSPPGKRLRIIPVRGDEARAADEAAVARGQTGYVNPPRLQKALHARAKRRMEQARLSQ
jgi:hypothetical protein